MGESDILKQIELAEAEYADAVTSRYRAIAAAESYSSDKIEALRKYVEDTPPPRVADIHLIAAAGSLARREASRESDADLIILTNSELSPEAKTQLLEWRDRLCTTLQLEKPNPNGVFAKPVPVGQVLVIAGNENESYSNVAVRVLLLLESEWVSDPDNYRSAIEKIIAEYTSYVTKSPTKNFVFLLNDVIRYFRTICVNYQHTTSETNDGKWPIRNVKLRHSRVLMYFSMVAAIGTLSRVYNADKVVALKVLIGLPPLKRLFVCYRLADDPAFFKVCGLYDVFLHTLSDGESRAELNKFDYKERYSSPVFAHMKATSDALCSELLRFYEARRQSWDDRFFEYMIV